jgi:hypothetical protein
VLRALERLFGFERPQAQLTLELETRPRNAEELRELLVRLGLDRRYRCRLTSNRTVFVSYSDDEIRLHRGYLEAPEKTLRAIVAFVHRRSRTARNEAKRVLLEYDVHGGHEPSIRPRRSPESNHPEDELIVGKLRRAHGSLNDEKFGGVLATIPIRVSRRMKSRLGHYTHRDRSGAGAEIVISRRHIRRHGWTEAIETLLHEMVHQWQDETGHTVDHGRGFRAKARAVGIAPTARRDVA